MADAYQTFSANLRRLRKERGWTHEQLALEADMKMQEVQRIEGGQREPRVRVIDRLAVALDVDPGELFAPRRAPERAEPPPRWRGL